MKSPVARLSSATMGGCEKPQTDKRIKRQQETVCHNIMTTISIFSESKRQQRHLFICGERPVSQHIAKWFSFHNRNAQSQVVHCKSVSSAAVDCAFRKTISPKSNESHLLNNLASVCCWLH